MKAPYPGFVQTITPAELAALEIAPVVVDVRELDEFEAVRVPGALHIPLGELVDRADEIPDEGTLYFICHSGARSERAAAYFEAQGRETVNVEGGTARWYQEGLPVEGARVGAR